MHAFAGAMLGSNIETNVSFTIIPDDSNYLDNEICPKYVRDVDDNPQTSKEYDRFLQGRSLSTRMSSNLLHDFENKIFCY